MPTPVRRPVAVTPRATAPAGGAYTVRPGDTLSAIAARTLGSAARWRELYELNRVAIGPNPGAIKVGTRLRMPGAAPVPGNQPTPKPNPTPTPTPTPSGRVDSDRDGIIDRFDLSPRNAADRRWNQAAADEYAAFVGPEVDRLRAAGTEIDCADLAAKLLQSFCDKVGLPNPLAGKGTWHTYRPGADGGLPNVNGPTHFLTGIHADNLAKSHTRDVTDTNGDGIAGWDRATGAVDVADLRAGDILFYDWDGDGKVNHTVNVVGVEADGTVTLAYGTYDNLDKEQALTWSNLDLLPIRHLVLKPGTEDYSKWLGEGNALWGARRFGWMAEAASAPKPAAVATPAEPAPVAPVTAAPAPAPVVPAPAVTPAPMPLRTFVDSLQLSR
jgi:LysM repeat protein